MFSYPLGIMHRAECTPLSIKTYPDLSNSDETPSIKSNRIDHYVVVRSCTVFVLRGCSNNTPYNNNNYYYHPDIDKFGFFYFYVLFFWLLNFNPFSLVQ